MRCIFSAAGWKKMKSTTSFFPTKTYSDHTDGAHVHMLNWLKDKGYIQHKSKKLSANAAETGNLEVLKWCKQNGFLLSSDICEYAAINKHYEIVRWGMLNFCTISLNTINNIICGGDKEMILSPWRGPCLRSSRLERNQVYDLILSLLRSSPVKWFLDIGYEIDESTCQSVAREGRLSVLKMLRERGCRKKYSLGCIFFQPALTGQGEWDSEVCDYAACYGARKIDP